MKINALDIQDFQGLEGDHRYDLEGKKIVARIAKNGTGKTSFLNAIRYGLTGAEPEGEMITHGKDMTTVGFVMESGTSFVRRKTRIGQKCYINRKQVGVAAFNEQIVRAAGSGEIKLLSSSEVFGSLAPDAFEALLLKYTTDTDKQKVYESITDLTDTKKAMLEERLKKDPVSLSDLDAVYKDLYEARKNARKELTDMKAEMDALKRGGLKVPSAGRDELQAAYDAAEKAGKDAALIKSRMTAYDSAVKREEARQDTIKRLEEAISAIKIPKEYSEEKEAAARKKMDEAAENYRRLVKEEAAIEASVASQEKALKLLDTSVCPLSDKLTCTTDKTAVRDELTKALESLKESLETFKKAIEKEKQDGRKCKSYLTMASEAKAQMARRKALEEEKGKAEKTVIEIPEKPEAVDVDKALKVRDDAQRALWNYDNYTAYIDLKRKFAARRAEYVDIDSLVVSLAPKGEVKEAIVKGFLAGLEARCNAESSKLGDGKMKISFKQEKGVKILADPKGTGAMIPLEAVSGGEKAKVLFILLSILSVMSGFKVLLLDELSVLDKEGMDTMLQLIVDQQDDFDHVFLCAVDHDDTVALIKKHGIDVVNA